MDKLKVLRGDALNLSVVLTRDFSLIKDDIGTLARLLWDHEANIQNDTMDLLQKLERLQTAQYDLHSKLTALERSLYNVDE